MNSLHLWIAPAIIMDSMRKVRLRARFGLFLLVVTFGGLASYVWLTLPPQSSFDANPRFVSGRADPDAYATEYSTEFFGYLYDREPMSEPGSSTMSTTCVPLVFHYEFNSVQVNVDFHT